MSLEAVSLRDSSVENQQHEENIRAFQVFEKLALSSTLSAKTISLLRQQMIYLLQFVTINTEKTLFTITSDELTPWLHTALGFYEHDLRVDLLSLLFPSIPNSALRVEYQKGFRILRQMGEQLFWRKYHRDLWSRTRLYFSSITQEDILNTEIKGIPLYQAVSEVYPSMGYGGVFDDSDNEILSYLKKNTDKKEGLQITDVGCGKGRLLAKIGQEFPGACLNGTSIFKFSDEELKYLKDQNIRPIFCTATQINLPDCSQDIVVSTEVIEHLRDPEDLVREVARILKPGGIFYITAPGKIAQMYGKNPFSYLAVALSVFFPKLLPSFHNLYSPLTPIKLVHYGFGLDEFYRLFLNHFQDTKVFTTRFVALRKFGIEKVASKLPVFRFMGGLLIAAGKKSIRPFLLICWYLIFIGSGLAAEKNSNQNLEKRDFLQFEKEVRLACETSIKDTSITRQALAKSTRDRLQVRLNSLKKQIEQLSQDLEEDRLERLEESIQKARKLSGALLRQYQLSISSEQLGERSPASIEESLQKVRAAQERLKNLEDRYQRKKLDEAKKDKGELTYQTLSSLVEMSDQYQSLLQKVTNCAIGQGGEGKTAETPKDQGQGGDYQRPSTGGSF